MTNNTQSLGEHFDSMTDGEVVEWCAEKVMGWRPIRIMDDSDGRLLRGFEETMRGFMKSTPRERLRALYVETDGGGSQLDSHHGGMLPNNKAEDSPLLDTPINS